MELKTRTERPIVDCGTRAMLCLTVEKDVVVNDLTAVLLEEMRQTRCEKLRDSISEFFKT